MRKRAGTEGGPSVLGSLRLHYSPFVGSRSPRLVSPADYLQETLERAGAAVALTTLAGALTSLFARPRLVRSQRLIPFSSINLCLCMSSSFFPITALKS